MQQYDHQNKRVIIARYAESLLRLEKKKRLVIKFGNVYEIGKLRKFIAAGQGGIGANIVLRGCPGVPAGTAFAPGLSRFI